jgi:DNA-binding transcriptional LysR family regulator
MAAADRLGRPREGVCYRPRVGPLDPRKLETFRTVVQAGSISAAARVLHLSQPAVTAQIAALEEECGRAVLTRTARGVLVNAYGQRLLDVANQVHGLLDDAALAMLDEPEVRGELVLAASMTTAGCIVPPLLAGFRAGHPSVAIRVEVGNTSQVADWVGEGRVPFGMVDGLTRASHLHLERYLDDELVAVASPRAPALAGLRSAEELRSAPLVLREPGSGSRAVVDAALERAVGARDASRDLQLGSNQAVKMAAVEGLGVAFFSRWNVRAELALGLLRVLDLPGLRMTLQFAWALPARELGGLSGLFLSWARRHAPSLRDDGTPGLA